jgi:hypothetical protein
VRQLFAILLASAITISGIALGVGLSMLTDEAWDGLGYAAVVVISALELLLGGIGLYIGYRIYFRLTR